MKQKIVIALVLILLFSIAAGILYLNNIYLPTTIKARLINTLEKSLNYNVNIEKLRYGLIKGIIIEDFAIFDRVKDKENTIFTAKEISFHFLFLPLIKEKKIAIPIIYIDKPYLYIRYQKNGSLNFSKISPGKPGPQPKEKAKKERLSFFIYKIDVSQGKCVFTDERLTPKFSKIISDLNIGLAITPLAKISFLFQGKLLTDKETFSKVQVQGDYNLPSKEINSKINLANLSIPEFNAYLKELPLTITSGSIEDAAVDFKSKDNLIIIKGDIRTKGLELRKQGLALMGDLNIDSDLTYAVDKKALDYKLIVKFMQANLLGLKYLEKINNISGDISLKENKIWSDNLKLEALNSPFMLKGTLENFLNPYLKLNLSSEQLNLERLLAVLPNKLQGLNLTGTSLADINIEGYLSKLPLDITASFDVTDTKLQAKLLKEPLNNIKGKVDFSQDNISWSEVSFNYLNTIYASTGKLTNLQSPQINFGLSSKELELNSDIKIKDNIVKINRCEGKYLNSTFDIKGNIDTRVNDNPLLGLSAKLNLNAQDAIIFLPNALKEAFKKIKPEGNLDIRGVLNGKAKDYKDWGLSINANSDAFSIYSLKFNNLLFSFEQKNTLLNSGRLTASGYSGIINLDFDYDLKPDLPAYSLKFGGAGIDLEKLKTDTNLKDMALSGTLNVNAYLNGNFKDFNSLKGEGSLSIKDGNLWQLNFFKGLGELFLVQEYEKIIFKDAAGDFTIKDNFISTENLKLTSDLLNLNCQGKLGFDGGLDFTVYTDANRNMIRESADLRKFTSAIFGELSRTLVTQVSGTVQKPKYKTVPLPLDMIKTIKDLFLGK